MKKFIQCLESHDSYKKRKQESSERLKILEKEFVEHEYLKGKGICIYIAGSLARYEFGKKSDLDLFVISEEEIIQPLWTESP